jgi:hypothetical protein
MEIPQTSQGSGAIEVQLLMNDTAPIDRLLLYDRIGESSSFTDNDAKKFKEPSFANIYSLTKGGESLSLDAQDVTSRLNSGEPQVEIPLVIDRDFNKVQSGLRLRIWEKHSELQTFFKDAKTGQEYTAESFDDLPIAFESDEIVMNRYSLVFRLSKSAVKDPINETAKNNGSKSLVMLAYPNPTDGKLSLKLSNGESYQGGYELFDMVGRLVQKGNSNDKKQLDLSALVDGQYLLKSKYNVVIIIKK